MKTIKGVALLKKSRLLLFKIFMWKFQIFEFLISKNFSTAKPMSKEKKNLEEDEKYGT